MCSEAFLRILEESFLYHLWIIFSMPAFFTGFFILYQVRRYSANLVAFWEGICRPAPFEELEVPEEFLLLPTWPLAFTADLFYETPAAALVVARGLRDTYRVELEGPSARTEEEGGAGGLFFLPVAARALLRHWVSALWWQHFSPARSLLCWPRGTVAVVQDSRQQCGPPKRWFGHLD